MFSLVEALNYRCLRYVSQPLAGFHVLVGPNASGKSTFLDVIGFLGDLVSKGPEAAVNERTNNFRDLVWARQGRRFELAIEAKIPKDRLAGLGSNGQFKTIRYEVAIGSSERQGEISILAERVSLKRQATVATQQYRLFPEAPKPPTSILAAKGVRTVINKVPGGNDNFYSEVTEKGGKGWVPSFRLGARRSALANLPEDESKFPAATWLKGLLSEGVRRIALNSRLMRLASPPSKGRGFEPDGSNLPWVISRLRRNPAHRQKLEEWIAHVRTALADVKSVKTVIRPDDRHRYLVLTYAEKLRIPSWMVSDGTLRLLALTLPAYLPEFSGVYLIEEPENGIHPRAVETVFQSLSSVYDAQILMATHSPVILSITDVEDVLCFARTAEGATDIVTGSAHPALRDWKGETNLGVLFASGILG